MEFYLLPDEADTLIHWWKNYSKHQSRFGSTTYIFPMEDYLLSKLRHHTPIVSFDEMDLDIFIEWMEKSLMPHPGQQVFYLPGEESLARHLRQLQDANKKSPSIHQEAQARENAVRTADKLLRDKKNRSEL